MAADGRENRAGMGCTMRIVVAIPGLVLALLSAHVARGRNPRRFASRDGHRVPCRRRGDAHRAPVAAEGRAHARVQRFAGRGRAWFHPRRRQGHRRPRHPVGRHASPLHPARRSGEAAGGTQGHRGPNREASRRARTHSRPRRRRADAENAAAKSRADAGAPATGRRAAGAELFARAAYRLATDPVADR